MKKSIKRFLNSLSLSLSILFICITLLAIAPQNARADHGNWHKVELPVAITPLDLWFDRNKPSHGWLVGTEATLLESTDGGTTWEERKLDLGGSIYRFSSISFSGKEGWITGQPALLLHTTDDGKSWSRIGLSSKLPGDPFAIVASGKNSAEMVTDLGAIYSTQDAGQNWKAMVTQAVGNARNLNRSADGRYVAISANGNFYSTWQPGDMTWVQHNRNSSRRVQNMGYTPDNRLWMLNRGGQVQFSEVGDFETWNKKQTPRQGGGFGLLDLKYQDDDNVWISGGSSRLLHSTDGGKTWVRDLSAANVGANLYKIYFFSSDRGFVLGQNGTLLAYSPD
ncbi:MAG: photosystem II assembly protein [Oscillatoriales cyanobacterium CG2_30_44_21]|nr:MAG: photosystem II assembly protein [Oscillatoriales cyanobacterium CG2_30_44_21]